MKSIKFLKIIFFLFIFNSCQEDDYEFGNIISPSNLIVDVIIQGTDNDNPNGDGSGNVTFVATADNAITYKFISNGVEYMQPSGVFSTTFTNTGIFSYEVIIIASGIAGETTQVNASAEVLYTYEPPEELVNALTTGSWRVMAEANGHIGVHDPGSFHDGVDTFPEWYSASPFQQANTGMYDDRIIFLSDGSAQFLTQGFIFGDATALENDFTGNQGLTPNQYNEHQYYPADDFSFSWSISENDDGYLVLNFSGNGFTGNYVGGNHQYVITHRNSDSTELYLKTIGLDTNAWYAKITNQ